MFIEISNIINAIKAVRDCVWTQAIAAIKYTITCQRLTFVFSGRNKAIKNATKK